MYTNWTDTRRSLYLINKQISPPPLVIPNTIGMNDFDKDLSSYE